jgi:hypothetical protein
MQMEILGMVENMSGYTCPHCGKSIGLFGSGGGERTAALSGLKLLGRIPFDPNLVQCGDAGISYQKRYADSQATKAFGLIASKISTSTRG